MKIRMPDQTSWSIFGLDPTKYMSVENIVNTFLKTALDDNTDEEGRQMCKHIADYFESAKLSQPKE